MNALTIPVLLAVCLAGCATPRPNEAGTLALYRAHAGEPVRQFRYAGNAIGWERIDGEHVLLNMRPRESWLLRLSGACLDWGSGAPTIGLTSNNGIVSVRFDQVLVNGAPMGCRIEEIRRVDTQAVRAARKALPDQASGT